LKQILYFLQPGTKKVYIRGNYINRKFA